MNEKRIKSAASQAVSYRNYRRARDRALTKLATAHFEQYKELLEKEKAFDEQMGKKWLDINSQAAQDYQTGKIYVNPVDKQFYIYLQIKNNYDKVNRSWTRWTRRRIKDSRRYNSMFF